MRAVAVKELRGAPELMDLPNPAPAPGEVLVQVQAAGVNPYDWKIIDGALEGRMPHVFPLIVGVDGAGTVEAVGPGVRRFAVGDGIYGQFLHAPVGTGTYTEYTTVPETNGVAPIPRGMYSAQAAAVPTAGMEALHALDLLQLRKGQSLLIHGAAGGIGSFATQLASNAGILAVTTARGPHREYLHRLGAYRFFDANSLRLVEEIRSAYPDGVDALLDLYDPPAGLEGMLPLVKPGGLVASSVNAVDEPAMAARGYHGINVNAHPAPELLERLGTEFAAGRLRVPMEQRVPLLEAPRVLAESRSGALKGKVVLTI